MATLRLCSIPDCDKPATRRGWCNAHYQRWLKYGYPLAGRGHPASEGQPTHYLENTVLTHIGEECVFWPFAKTQGYGRIRRDGRSQLVHRLVCQLVNGSPPTPAHQAAHSCGNGDSGCVSPAHLSWKTNTENSADKFIHGTQMRGENQTNAKLTERQVRTILAMKGKMLQKDIAAQYGVSKQLISSIHRRLAWSWV